MKRILNLAKLPFQKRLPVGTTPSTVVHEENKWKLLRYQPRPEGVAHRRPVLLVPSLINRHYVLDLLPGKSFAEYLVKQGHDVFCIDWGRPEAEDRYLTMDEVTDVYLGRAIRRARALAQADKTHVLGYCLGGTLAAIHSARRPESPVASLVALAAPVSFKQGGLLRSWAEAEGFDAQSMSEAFGLVPWPLLQSTFHMLRPTLNLSKTVQLLDRAEDETFLKAFRAVETWGNDNVSLAGECYKTLLTDLYKDDALIQGKYSSCGEAVSLGNIRHPVATVTFEQDNIVPPASALPLLDHVGSVDKKSIHLKGGHVGAVVSSGAAKNLWPQLSEYWATREEPKPEQTSPGTQPRPVSATSSSSAKRRKSERASVSSH